MKITIDVKGQDKQVLIDAMAKLMSSYGAAEATETVQLPEIDWENAPEDAVCHAYDKSGKGYFCNCDIEPGDYNAWDFSNEAYRAKVWEEVETSMRFYPGVNMPPFEDDSWKQTLQMRPEEKEEEKQLRWEKRYCGLPQDQMCVLGDFYALVWNDLFLGWTYAVYDAVKNSSVSSGKSGSEQEAKETAEFLLVNAASKSERAQAANRGRFGGESIQVEPTKPTEEEYPEIPWYFNGSDLICDYFTGYTAYVNALDGSWLIVNAGGRNIGGANSGSVAKAIDEAEAFLLEAAKS